MLARIEPETAIIMPLSSGQSKGRPCQKTKAGCVPEILNTNDFNNKKLPLNTLVPGTRQAV